MKINIKNCNLDNNDVETNTIVHKFTIIIFQYIFIVSKYKKLKKYLYK